MKVPGAVDLALEANRGKLQVRISADREQLARDGMNADDVLTAVSTGIGNEPVNTLIEGVKRCNITARLGPDASAFIEAIRNIPIRTASGAIIPLSKVAKVSANEGYSFIRREQLQRCVVIQMDVRGRDMNSFVHDVDAAIAKKVKLPPGYWIEWGGAFENQQ